MFANAESLAAHLLEQKSLYVSLPRVKAENVLYTDELSKMQVGLQERVGMAASAPTERELEIQDGKHKAPKQAYDVILAL